MMQTSMSNKIAIITARSGSKRIPKKNIKSFLGKPIIQYSIEAALQAGCFEEVMVSTDDEEIAEVAKSLGANVPFFRSAVNSNDFATTADVIIEVLNEYKKSEIFFDITCCIYPTAPFVTAQKLIDAIQLFEKNNADTVLPVAKFSFPVLRSLKIENDKLQFNWPQYSLTRSQDLAPAYQDCGQFYILRNLIFLKKKKLITDNSFPIEISELEMQDIDNEDDWKIAELKYQLLNQRK